MGIDDLFFSQDTATNTHVKPSKLSRGDKQSKVLTQTSTAKAVTGLVLHCCRVHSRLAAAASRGVLDPSPAMFQAAIAPFVWTPARANQPSTSVPRGTLMAEER